MGLTTAMYTGLTGINANQTRINTIGNNIANVNTTAFKGSRTLFQSQLAQTLSLGTAPSDVSGGTNPIQIGLGVDLGTTQRDFTPGSLETTGIASDLALNGRGFFVLRDMDGAQVYTRDGSFTLDSQNRLVTMDGKFVQGFGVDGGYNIVPGVLTDIAIPLGTVSVARPTSTVIMDGDLSSAGTIATHGSEHASQAMVDGGGNAVTAATALTDVFSAANPGTALFATGNTITVSGVVKGERELPARSFVVGTDGTTLGDFANWLQGALGINTDAGVPGTPGVTIENGALVIRGNAGEQNNFGISGSDFASDNAAVSLPFQFTQNATADGSGVFTSFTAYDSLGSPVTVNLTFALESTPNGGPVWRYYAESPDTSNGSRVLGTGTVSFNNRGGFVDAVGNQITLDRSGTGSATPLTFTLDLSGVNGLSTQTSNIVASEQDGFPPGTLVNFGIGEDGVITGAFTNGLTQKLGQIAVATFSNEEGLVGLADNCYSVGPASGNATIGSPGQLGAGKVMSGALELSNVDLSREFIGLVTSSTGFQASSRVISVSSDLLNQLLLIIR
jgi:flagellar hook protein FlgE